MKNIYGNGFLNESPFCGCCGSNYFTNPITLDMKTTGIGLSLAGEAEPQENDRYKIDVVSTKNGPITFLLRKKQ